jgi:hypothetical protein
MNLNGEKYNKIQYKLWDEALDDKQHESKDVPPSGPIWGSQKSKKSAGTRSVDTMASTFTHMVNTVASAFSPPKQEAPTSSTNLAGILPGRNYNRLI